jgi:peptidoglycan/xylan/chitin deacetylase (PgdA/CDA1 family)
MKSLISLLSVFTVLMAPQAFAASELAITIDDLPRHGPLPEGVTRTDLTHKMLDALKKHKVPEVYGFVNAAKISGKEDSEPKLIDDLKLWVKAGYPLGNHTFSHIDLNKATADEFNHEITENEAVLKKLNGKMNWHFLRYPYLREGDTLEKRNAVRAFLKKNHYQVAQVTVDFEDWSWNGPYVRCLKEKKLEDIAWLKQTYLQNAMDQMKRAKLLSQALFKHPIKHILLLHIGAMDAEMLDELLTAYEKIGVKFIGLSAASKDPVYQIDPEVVGKRGSELTYQVMQSRKLTLKDLGIPSYGDQYPEEKLEKICR